jgi:hypothetical protein
VVLSAWFPKAMLAGLTLIAGCTPVPLNETVVEEGALLLEMLIAPLRVPVAVGRNVTWITQLLFAATLAGQLLLWEKSPLMLMELICSGALLVFISVTIWEALLVFTSWFAKLRLAGDSVGAASTPLPERGTLVGLVGASLVMLSVAEPGPGDRGVNPIWIVQLPPAGVPDPTTQVLVTVYRSG